MKATQQLAVLSCGAVYYAVQGGYKPGGVLSKVIYGEAPPRGSNPYPLQGDHSNESY